MLGSFACAALHTKLGQKRDTASTALENFVSGLSVQKIAISQADAVRVFSYFKSHVYCKALTVVYEMEWNRDHDLDKPSWAATIASTTLVDGLVHENIIY